MTPESWLLVKDALHEAMQLQGETRHAYLATVTLTDPALRLELDRLLSASEQMLPEFMDAPAVAAWNGLAPPDQMVGRRLGPYQIIEKIGAGGMGEVYRAIRADDEYRQEVAIKLVHAEFASNFVLSRLRQERQILAGLDHPNVTRLLDGGRTAEGIPYLVMELIEGEPIHQFCKRHDSTTEEKLRLMMQVCMAVHYAHQRLIIHRDIKPGNILVTAAKVPKLLDFGIAKILDQSFAATGPEQASATLSVIRLYTPRYASPEQLKGETITTSTDVFSLGVVLQELLTDAPPAKGATKSLGANLDNIIQMATRPEPDRRYSSAEALANDISRHLDNLPVIARGNTLKYRLSTFVARHTVAIAASALLAVALLGATVVSLYEAQAARSERVRAERRFNDARRLANSLMREIYGSIKDLPGATPARKLLVNKALEYLDGLSGDALSDTALEQELASAYALVSDVQGNPYNANLGDPVGGLESSRKALAIRLRLSAAAPANADAVRAIAGSYVQMGAMVGATRDSRAATSYFEAAALLLERVDQGSKDARVLDQLAGTYYFAADAEIRARDIQRAQTAIERASRIRDGIVSVDPGQSRLIRSHSAGDHAAAANVFVAQKKYSEALIEQRKAVDIISALAADSPADATLQSYVAQGFDYLGRIQEYLNDQSGALLSYIRANESVAPIAKLDPQNTFAVSMLAHSYERMGRLEDDRLGSTLLGSLQIARAIELMTPLRAKSPDNAELSARVAQAYSELGSAIQMESLRPSEHPRKAQLLGAACEAHRKSVDGWLELKKHASLELFEKNGYAPSDAAKSLEQCEHLLAQVNTEKAPGSPQR
jgi:non-specific serine/threonine protein kinase/serine/threonine-protein kinase